MTRTEHLLTILGEECNEIAHRVSKALRFSLTEVQPGQNQDNAQRIIDEFLQLEAMVDKLVDEGILPAMSSTYAHGMRIKKIEMVEKYLKLSASCGTLTADRPNRLPRHLG